MVIDCENVQFDILVAIRHQGVPKYGSSEQNEVYLPNCNKRGADLIQMFLPDNQ